MRELGQPAEAHFLAGLLTGDEGLFARALEELEPFFGPVMRESEAVPWTHSSYYEDELGTDLLRKFVFFSRCVDPILLVEAKKATMEVERKLGRKTTGGITESDSSGTSDGIKRHINIDPGYMTRAKLVLASSKDFSHRIYLGGGVHAEVTLYFKDESFRPFFYTYQDYKDEKNISLFNEVRKEFFSAGYR